MILSVMLFACGPEEGTLEAAETTWVQNLQTASSEEIPVVVEVSFDTPSEVTAWIEFGAGSPDERTTAVTSAGSEHTIAVIGALPLTEVQMQVVVEADEELGAARGQAPDRRRPGDAREDS